MSEQACKTPLIDLLRNVPKYYMTRWPIQWSEDGSETGHAMCPIGRLVHEAADRIVELEALQHSGEPVVGTDCVQLPTNVDQARAMAIVGTNWLKDHAPDQLIAPQPATTAPIAAVKGWFHGECVIQALDPAAVLPAGMALYATPQPVVDVFDSLISPAILSFAKGEDELLVRRIWDKVRVAMLSAVNK